MPTALPGDKNCHHFVMTSLESHDEEDSLSQSTGAYSVKLATTLTEGDLNVVKNVNTLDHVSINVVNKVAVDFFCSRIFIVV